MYYTPLVGILVNLQLWCRWTDYILTWGQKVKGQGHSKTTYGQISSLGDIFSRICEMREHSLIKKS